MRLDHVNVRCSDLQATAAFFESVVGLKAGWRPPFSIPGLWLYDETGRAVVHLLLAATPLGDVGAVDHVAFRYDDLGPQLQHLASLGHRCETVQVPGTSIHQCFLLGPDRLQIEFQGELRAA
jgi:catechol 2,3-dioxygenase-like lactoylglutathione lyase family enzyme